MWRGALLVLVPTAALAWPVDGFIDVELGKDKLVKFGALDAATIDEASVAEVEVMPESGELLVGGKKKGRAQSNCHQQRKAKHPKDDGRFTEELAQARFDQFFERRKGGIIGFAFALGPDDLGVILLLGLRGLRCGGRRSVSHRSTPCRSRTEIHRLKLPGEL
jgi:hypothetical protein